MRKYRFKTWQLALILLLSVLTPITIIFAQKKPDAALTETCKGTHTVKTFYKSVRHLEPATVLEIVDNRLNYATASEGIELGSLQLEDNWTRLPKDFGPKSLGGCVGIIYCDKHLVALEINELESRYCKTFKQ